MFGKSERFEDYHFELGSNAVGFALSLRAGADKIVPASPNCQLVLPQAGTVRVSAGDVLWFLGPGNGLLLGVGVQARISAVRHCVVHVAQLLVRDSQWRQITASRVLATDLIRSLLGELVQAPSGPPSQRIHRIARLLLDEVQLEQTPPISLPKPSDKRLLLACAAVLDDPAKEWGIEALSRLAGMSTRSLSRAFVEQTGTTLGQWCRSVRLATALSEVARGGGLHEAAAAAGFAAPSSLCAAFRQATGTTFRGYFRTRPISTTQDEASFFR